MCVGIKLGGLTFKDFFVDTYI